MDDRALTRAERSAIRELVQQCVNYDRADRLCLLLDMADQSADCPMLEVRTPGKACGYFKAAVLPLNPILEAVLCARPVETRRCEICGSDFLPRNNRQQYCGEKCQIQGRRKKDRELRREARKSAG